MASSGPDDLEPILQAALSIGVRVQMAGGYTARVRDTARRVALNLGADDAQTWLSSGSLGVTITRDGRTHTAVRTVPALGVNFAELTELSRLARGSAGSTPAQIEAAVSLLASKSRRYPAPLVVLLLGIACGSLAGLFGAQPWGSRWPRWGPRPGPPSGT